MAGNQFARWMQRLAIDRTTSIAIAVRIWQAIASPLTMILLIFYFSDQERGLYWVFWSTLGFQVIAELGFQWVVLNVVSHEWSELSLDERRLPQGNARSQERLASIARLVVLWYISASALVMPLIWFVGFQQFSRSAPSNVSWLWPWTILSVISAVSLTVSACVSVLEGCNQVATIQRIRLLQVITGSLSVWILIVMGGGLWVAVAASAIQLMWELFLVLHLYGRFWQAMFSLTIAPQNRVSWSRELWPLQWNIALQSISHYFAYQTMVLVMQPHSLELAGRMGMTWQIVNACLLIGATWLQVRAPHFGILVAQQKFAELNEMFRRLLWVSFGALCGLLVLFVLAVGTANVVPGQLAGKVANAFLPTQTVAIFCIGAALVHLSRSMNLYLRAHKRDPMIWTNVGCNLLLWILIFGLGSQYGAGAAACAFTGTIACIQLPLSWYVWRQSRRRWQAQSLA